MEMIEVTLARLWIDKAKETFVLILQESGGQRLLPIWIGPAEAESIRIHLAGIPHERPLTHDLFKNMISALGGTVERIQITKVHQNTYFAELIVTVAGEAMTIDARPSDSIAIAVRTNAPIFAAESLLVIVGEEEGSALSAPDQETETEDEPASSEELSAEQLKAYLEKLRPEDFGKFNP